MMETMTGSQSDKQSKSADNSEELVDRFLDAISGSPAQTFREERVETVAVIGRADFESPFLGGQTHVALSAGNLAVEGRHDAEDSRSGGGQVME